MTASTAASSNIPALAIDTSPWSVANATIATCSGSPGDDLAGGLSFGDHRQRRDERALAGLAQRGRRVGLVLGGEHQLQERRVAAGEADVGPGQRLQAVVTAPARAGDRRAQLVAQPHEPGLGHRVQQRLLVGEVPARRRVADADGAGQLAQRQPGGAPVSSARSPSRSSASRRLPWW